jgi:hypothetical protein
MPIDGRVEMVIPATGFRRIGWRHAENDRGADRDAPENNSSLVAPEPARLEITSLAELLANPELMQRPQAVIPYIAYKGRVSLLAAPEKLGKSTLMGHHVARLSRGEPILGQAIEAGTTLYITEEHIGDAARRFRDFGADPARVHVARMPMGGTPVQRVQWIRDAVQESEYADVVIDTLPALIAGLSSFWDPAVMTAVTMPLSAIAHELEVAIILLTHAKKSDGRYRDSSEIGARVDVIVEMSKIDTSPAHHRRLDIRGRYGVDDITVAFDGTTYAIPAREDRLPLAMRVLDYITHHPGCSQNAVERDIDGRAADIRAAIFTLKAERRIEDQTETRRGREYSHLFPRGFSVRPELPFQEPPDAPRDALPEFRS